MYIKLYLIFTINVYFSEELSLNYYDDGLYNKLKLDDDNHDYILEHLNFNIMKETPNNNTEYLLYFSKFYRNLKDTFVDLKNFKNIDINIIKKFVYDIWENFTLMNFLKNLLYFIIFLIGLVGLVVFLFWYFLNKLLDHKNIISFSLGKNIILNSVYKNFFINNSKENSKYINDKLDTINDVFLQKYDSSKKKTVEKFESKVDNLISLIKKNQGKINNEYLENLGILGKKTYFHLKKINNNFKELENTDNVLKKEKTLEILKNIYYILDISIDVVNNKLIDIEILDQIVEIICFMIATDYKILRLTLNASVLKSIQLSIKNLILRVDNNKDFTFFQLKPQNDEKILFDLVPSNKYINPLSIFDEEFYEDIVKISIENILNINNVLNKSFFNGPVNFFLNKIKTYLLFPEMVASIKNIIYINMNFINEIDLLEKRRKENNKLKNTTNLDLNKQMIHDTETKIDEKNQRIISFLFTKFLTYTPKVSVYNKNNDNIKFEINKFDYNTNIEYVEYEDFLNLKEEVNLVEYLHLILNNMGKIPQDYENILFLIYYIYIHLINGLDIASIFKYKLNYKDIRVIEDFFTKADFKQIILFIEKHAPNLIQKMNLINLDSIKNLNNFLKNINNENFGKLIFQYISKDDKDDPKEEIAKSQTEYLKFFEKITNGKKIEEIMRFFINEIKNNKSIYEIINENKNGNTIALIKIFLFFVHSLSIKDSNINIYEINRIFENINKNFFSNKKEKNFLDIVSDSFIINRIIKIILENCKNPTSKESLHQIIASLYKIINNNSQREETNNIIIKIHNILKLIDKKNDSLLYSEEEIKNNENLKALQYNSIINIIVLLLEDLTNRDVAHGNINIIGTILKNSGERQNQINLSNKKPSVVFLNNENVEKITEILKYIQKSKFLIKTITDIFPTLFEDPTKETTFNYKIKKFFINLKDILQDETLKDLLVDFIQNLNIDAKGKEKIESKDVAIIYETFIKFLNHEINKIDYTKSMRDIICLIIENFKDSKELKDICEIISKNYSLIKTLMQISTKIKSEYKFIYEGGLYMIIKLMIPNLILIIKNYSIVDFFNPHIYQNLINKGSNE
jgi:hypothetical protein